MTDENRKPDAPLLKLDDLAQPEEIARNAARLEQDLGLSLLPALGVVGILAGSVWLCEAAPRLKYVTSTGLSVLGIIAVVMLVNRSFRGSQFLLTGGFGILLIAALALPGYVGLAVAGVVCLVFVAFVATRLLDRTSAWVFLPFVPISVLSLANAGHGVRVVFAVAVLGFVYAVAYRAHKRMAFLALIAAAGLGLYEVNLAVESRMLLGLCLVVILLAAIGYERKVPVEEQSDLRQLLGQGLVAGLMLMLIQTTIRSSLSLAISTWIWAIGMAGYQGARLGLEKCGQPVRAAWIAIAVSCAIWMSYESIPWHIQSTANLAVASLLQLFALRVMNRTLSEIAAALVLIVGARAVANVLVAGAGIHNLLVSLVTAAALLLLSLREPFGSSRPWWSGFVLGVHFEKLSYYGEGLKKILVAPIKRVGFVSAIVDGVAFALRWLRYCRGVNSRPFTDDVLFAAAVVLTCFSGSHFVYAQSRLHGFPWEASVVAASLVWSSVGLAVVLYGIRKGWLLQRFLGHLCILTPVAYVVWLLLSKREALDPIAEKALRAALLIEAGVCLTLLGVIRRRNEGPDTDTLPEDAGTGL